MQFKKKPLKDSMLEGEPPKPGECATFVYRPQWGANPERPPEELGLLPIPVESMVMTWTETPRCHSIEECSATIRKIQERHIADGMPDIRYHFLVGMDGNVYEGRGAKWKGIKYADVAVDSEMISGNSVEVALIDSYGTKGHWDQYKGISAVVNLGHEMNWLLPKFKFYISRGAFLTYMKPFDAMKYPIATQEDV